MKIIFINEKYKCFKLYEINFLVLVIKKMCVLIEKCIFTAILFYDLHSIHILLFLKHGKQVLM